MPTAVEPLTGWPAFVTRLPSIVTLVDVVTLMPTPVVPVTVNPRTTTQLLLVIEKPLPPPLSVTAAAGAAVNVTGALGVPEPTTVTFSGYVPAATTTVTPAVAFAAAALMVQNGVVAVPAPVPELVHCGFDRFTYHVLVAATVWVRAALVLTWWPASPPYAAVIEWEPAVSALVASWADPAPSGAVPNTSAPSRNV